MHEAPTNIFAAGENEPPVTTYEEYRNLCDATNTSFRELGLVSQPSYEAAAADSTTEWGIYQGKKLPWLVSIDHAAGYDAARCRELTQRAHTYILTVSGVVLSELLPELSEPLENASIIVEAPAAEYTSAMANLVALPNFRNMQPAEFIDPTIADETKRAASISIFKCLLQPLVEGPVSSRANPLSETWQQYSANSASTEGARDDNGVRLLAAKELAADSRLIDELWGVCESRFGELGEFHPVSMEESREFFVDMLLAENTSTIIKYDEGRPACFGIFQEDISACTWLSERFRQKVKAEAARNEQAILYYPELISRKGAQAQSAAVIDLVSKLIAERRRPTLVVFEVTNRSSVYVPKLVERYVERSEVVAISSGLVELDKLNYGYLIS